MKRKITVTTGTRADYGILRPVLQKINDHKKLQLFLIVTGMHLSKKHGLTINEIKKDGFEIYAKFPMISHTDSKFEVSANLGKSINTFSKLFKEIKPDINLVLGDRDEMLASAISAYHMNIPNAHIHGGDRSMGGIDEYSRHAITKISNIHFAATQNSKKRIIKMGENPKFIFMTGSPSIDEVKSQKITSKKDLHLKYNIIPSKENILLLFHPVTTQSEKSEQYISEILKAVIKLKKSVIAIAPNSDHGYSAILKNLQIASKKHSSISLFQNVPRSDFLGMLKNCGILVGNSSSGMIEASYFQIPVINIGIRQLDRERGKNVIDVQKISSTEIHKAIIKGFKMRKLKSMKIHPIYGLGKASEKIVQYLYKVKLDEELIQKQITY